MESSLEFSSSIGSISSLASSPCRVFKIIVIGDSGVGKTCLTYRFCNGQFPDKTEATIGVDFRERLIDIGGDKMKLQLWDTAGQERFRKSMVQHYYRNVQAVVFVYDVTSPASFRALPVWLEECRQNGLGHDVPRFLVGNKSDLQTDRQVPRDQAGKFAEANGMTLFLTSAKSPPNRTGRGSAGTGSGSQRHHHQQQQQQQQDDVEAIFVALASRLARQKRPVAMSSVSGYSSSFKIQAKRKAPKWNCTC